MALMKFNPTWPSVDVAYPTRLGRLLEQMFEQPFVRDENGSLFTGWMPAVDVIEEKDMIRLVAELPGVKPEDVKISLENNVLTIQGEKKKEEEVKDEKVRRYERTYGAFERRARRSSSRSTSGLPSSTPRHTDTKAVGRRRRSAALARIQRRTER